MKVLGIEGTAHTLGVGIATSQADALTAARKAGVTRGTATRGAGRAAADRAVILANQRAMLQPEDGGIVPREAAHHHAEVGPGLVQSALDEAGLSLDEIDAVAFSQGPGLGPCLRVAATLARALSLRLGVPLVGVNHCVAHLEIGRGLTDATDPVLLYASGANTQVIALARGRYRVFGETLDIGIGNALDKFARDNGIPFPGGPRIEQAAARSGADRFQSLPYTVKGMDLSFAGMATAAQRMVDKGVPFDDVCYSLQETAFAALCEVAERALAHTGKDELVLGGGVACNSRLQEMARTMAEARNASYFCPPRPVLIDNGAMIAWSGLRRLRAGQSTALAESTVMPHQRTDHVEVVV